MPESNSSTLQAPPDEFFIGWLKVPGGYARFLRVVVPALMLLVALAAIALPLKQRSPGTGVWDAQEQITLVGTITASPYSMLLTRDPQSPGVPQIWLLVQPGKHGAKDVAQAFQGQLVEVRGHTLHRDGRSMLELADDNPIQLADALTDQQRSQLQWPASRSVVTVTLQGEIIDPKCYLGAMKPGGGKTHKACAALCLRGGIPPMFVTLDEQNVETFYLLTTPDGDAWDESIIPYVGDAVKLTGQLVVNGDLLELRVPLRDIHRL